MPFALTDEDWIEIPACRFRVGLEPDERRRFAEISATFWRAVAIRAGVADDVPNEDEDPARLAKQLETLCEPYDADVPAFAIARRPVTNGQYRQFLAEVGGPAPLTWAKAQTADDLPVRGVTWVRANEFAAWAGGRLPFEAEWERAARGTERRLFPWGDRFDKAALWIDSRHPPDPMESATPDGAQWMVTGYDNNREWCADLRPRPRVPMLIGPGEIHPAHLWGRATHGGRPGNCILPCAAARGSNLADDPERDFHYQIGFRLVRADGRTMPVEPPVGPWVLASSRPIEIEERVVVPTLDQVRRESLFEFTRTWTVKEQLPAEVDADVEKLWFQLISFTQDVWRTATPTGVDPDRLTMGHTLVGVSLESLRRVTPGHGIFLWNIKYRLGPDGQALFAHPVVVYRMAHDKQIHTFQERFVPDQPETPIGQLTPEMIRRSVVDTFTFFEEYADADRAPR